MPLAHIPSSDLEDFETMLRLRDLSPSDFELPTRLRESRPSPALSVPPSMPSW
jgi:hypothetical protein